MLMIQLIIWTMNHKILIDTFWWVYSKSWIRPITAQNFLLAQEAQNTYQQICATSSPPISLQSRSLCHFSLLLSPTATSSSVLILHHHCPLLRRWNIFFPVNSFRCSFFPSSTSHNLLPYSPSNTLSIHTCNCHHGWSAFFTGRGNRRALRRSSQ